MEGHPGVPCGHLCLRPGEGAKVSKGRTTVLETPVPGGTLLPSCGSLESHGEGQQAWALPSDFSGVIPSPAGAFGFSMLWPLGN